LDLIAWRELVGGWILGDSKGNTDSVITRAEFVEEMNRLREYFREQFPTKAELREQFPTKGELREQFSTKAEVREHYVTKADLKDMEIRLMRWTVGTMIGGISVAVGLTAVLIRVLA
jgi:hypothetical protein